MPGKRIDTEGGVPKGGRTNRTGDPAQLAKLTTFIEKHEATIRRYMR
jgi:hypothetical protein